ncbi:heme exporter protein CcmD [Vibrio albus]|uniref:Heme exporter protein D n=1 Tax=Vibrio albus TaxID=2200953 RepID=A0A2U3BE68_9VIBR|nr:heme exporter protein CcmD [Vibrio albus]PWI35080.1 heme exporter protein CcmD [Vibrio albus]
MFFQSFSDLLSMGGYGSYVWSAFGFTASAMLILLVKSLRDGRCIIRAVRDKQSRQARIAAAKKLENTL